MNAQWCHVIAVSTFYGMIWEICVLWSLMIQSHSEMKKCSHSYSSAWLLTHIHANKVLQRNRHVLMVTDGQVRMSAGLEILYMPSKVWQLLELFRRRLKQGHWLPTLTTPLQQWLLNLQYSRIVHFECLMPSSGASNNVLMIWIRCVNMGNIQYVQF